MMRKTDGQAIDSSSHKSSFLSNQTESKLGMFLKQNKTSPSNPPHLLVLLCGQQIWDLCCCCNGFFVTVYFII